MCLEESDVYAEESEMYSVCNQRGVTCIVYIIRGG